MGEFCQFITFSLTQMSRITRQLIIGQVLTYQATTAVAPWLSRAKPSPCCLGSSVFVMFPAVGVGRMVKKGGEGIRPWSFTFGLANARFSHVPMGCRRQALFGGFLCYISVRFRQFWTIVGFVNYVESTQLPP